MSRWGLYLLSFPFLIVGIAAIIYLIYRYIHQFKAMRVKIFNFDSSHKSVYLFQNDKTISNTFLVGDSTTVSLKYGDIISASYNSKPSDGVSYNVSSSLYSPINSLYIFPDGIYSQDDVSLVEIINTTSYDLYITNQTGGLSVYGMDSPLKSQDSKKVYLHKNMLINIYYTSSSTPMYLYLFLNPSISTLTITETGVVSSY